MVWVFGLGADGKGSGGGQPDPPGVSGSLDTVPNGLLPNGSVLFTGELTTSGSAAIWLHNWDYLIAFPAPVVRSVFTYSFGVGVQVTWAGGEGPATFLSFIALGEAAKLTNREIMVNNDGFPLVTNFSSLTTSGGLNLQRSFLVEAGDVPAIALVVGVATALYPETEMEFSNCFICPAASIDPATAVGPSAERGIVNFHYQPLSPESLT